MDFKKVINPGRIGPAQVFCKIAFEGGRLSITGVVGPKKNGDATGSCGQIAPMMEFIEPGKGWTVAMVLKFMHRWEKWHLNDMRAGCEHQTEILEAEGPRGTKAISDRYEDLILDGRFKKCPACGYEYGTNWKTVEVPPDVLDFLRGLPDSTIVPAWI